VDEDPKREAPPTFPFFLTYMFSLHCYRFKGPDNISINPWFRTVSIASIPRPLFHYNTSKKIDSLATASPTLQLEMGLVTSRKSL
jgi:hypothetical protein